IGGAVIGISCIAPAYTLTSGLGPTISEVGVHTPSVLLIGFMPMLLVVFGYRELNTAMPASRTTFTWATRALGHWLAWIGGCGLVSATVLVLASLAAVAADSLSPLLSRVFSDPPIAELTRVPWINIPVPVVLTAAAAWISYSDVEATERLQVWLVAFQVLALGWFVVAALVQVAGGTAFDPTPVSIDWFNPFSAGDFSTVAAAVSLSIFLFWG